MQNSGNSVEEGDQQRAALQLFDDNPGCEGALELAVEADDQPLASRFFDQRRLCGEHDAIGEWVGEEDAAQQRLVCIEMGVRSLII